jgi:hypothetical protein
MDRLLIKVAYIKHVSVCKAWYMVVIKWIVLVESLIRL